MKLIIVGSSGYVGKELVQQALAHPSITSVVGLSRRETPVPDTLSNAADGAKLTSVVCEDFLNYSDSIKKELAYADACIWLLGITPTKAKGVEWDIVRKVCLDYTAEGLSVISKLPRNDASKPFTFVYTSGVAAERDQTKKPFLLPEYTLMRGQVENLVLDFAAKSDGAIKTCIAKPGLIRPSGLISSVLSIALPVVDLAHTAAALLKQAIDGPEKDTILNDDLSRIGKAALEAQQKSS